MFKAHKTRRRSRIQILVFVSIIFILFLSNSPDGFGQTIGESNSFSKSDLSVLSFGDPSLLKNLDRSDDMNLMMQLNDFENQKSKVNKTSLLGLAEVYMKLGIYHFVFNHASDAHEVSKKYFSKARSSILSIFRNKKISLSPSRKASLSYWLVLTDPEGLRNLKTTGRRLESIKHLGGGLKVRSRLATDLSLRKLGTGSKILSYPRAVRGLVTLEAFESLKRVNNLKALKDGRAVTSYLRGAGPKRDLPDGAFEMLRDHALASLFLAIPSVHKRRNKQELQSLIVLISSVSKLDLDVKSEFKLLMLKAKTFELLKSDRKAVGTYRQAAMLRQSDQPNFSEAMESAIRVQHSLAKWSKPSRFEIPKSHSPSESRRLKDLYLTYSQKDGGVSWAAVAELGLLEVNFNQKEDAFELWKNKLAESSRGPIPARALGYMLEDYAAGRAWDDLETLARLALKGKWTAVGRSSSLDLHGLLALALVFGAEENIAAGDSERAISRLSEYCDQYKGHKFHDKGLALLARTYKSIGQLAKSLDRWKELVQGHPSSAYCGEALYEGAAIAQVSGSEGLAATYLSSYLEEGRGEKNKGQEQEVARNFAILQEARGLTGDSIAAYQIMLKKNNGSEQFYKSEILRLTLRSGSVDDAALYARDILKNPNISSEQKLVAYEALKQKVFLTKNLKAIESLLREVAPEPICAEIAADLTLALVNLKMPKDVDDDFQSISLEKPERFLAQVIRKTKDVISSYESVCQLNEAAACIAALHQGGIWADARMNRLQEISITETLAAKTVNQFKEIRQSAIESIFSKTQAMAAKAKDLIEAGNSSPSLTREVMWSDADEWFLDDANGAASGGYLRFQFSTNEEQGS